MEEFDIKDAQFWGVDFSYELSKFIKDHKKEFTSGMLENELKAYNLAISHAVEILNMLCESDEKTSIVFYKKGLGTVTEYDIDDLEQMINEQ